MTGEIVFTRQPVAFINVLFFSFVVIEFSFSSAVAKEKLAKETTKFPRWPERGESKVSAPATCTSLFTDEKLNEWLQTFHFVSMAPSTVNFSGRVRHWSTEYISLSISSASCFRGINDNNLGFLRQI